MFGLFRKKTAIPVEPESKKVPVGERRIYVLDFDRTITILHTGALAYGNELTPAFIQSNIKKGFAEFVRKVINSGHGAYIASYSDDANADTVEAEALSGHDLIKLYMDLVFGQDQTIFTTPRENEAGEIMSKGNIIANNTQDYKQHHLDIILRQEGLTFPTQLRYDTFRAVSSHRSVPWKESTRDYTNYRFFSVGTTEDVGDAAGGTP